MSITQERGKERILPLLQSLPGWSCQEDLGLLGLFGMRTQVDSRSEDRYPLFCERRFHAGPRPALRDEWWVL